MEKTVEYTGMNDYLFKKIFQRRDILKKYLYILGIDVKEEDIIYENVEIKGEIRIKAVRFDIRIKASNYRINLEGQRQKIYGTTKEGQRVDYIEYQDHRKIHYAAKLHSEAYKEGDKYFEEAKTKIIFFLDYEIEGEGIQHTKYKNIETGKTHEDIEIIEVFLPKAGKNDTIEAKMFNVLREKRIEKYLKEEGVIKEVAKMIYEITEEERERLRKDFEEDMKRQNDDWVYLQTWQHYYDGKEEGLKEGIEQGLERGLEKGIYQTAKNLKALGVDIEMISKATGLSIEEIKKL